ncbi:Porin B precursor [compost metagenome]
MKLSMTSTFTLASGMVFAFDPLAQDQKRILGDWDGKRTQLEQQGYQFTGAFQNESVLNLSAGYEDSS